MVRNIIIAIIAIIILYFILVWAGVIGGGEEMEGAVEDVEVEEATE